MIISSTCLDLLYLGTVEVGSRNNQDDDYDQAEPDGLLMRAFLAILISLRNRWDLVGLDEDTVGSGSDLVDCDSGWNEVLLSVSLLELVVAGFSR